MISLEEEIVATCSTSYLFSNSQHNSDASDIFCIQEGKTLDLGLRFDLCYLIEASEDDLGIPSSSIVNLEQEVCISLKETSKGLSENLYLKSLA